MKKITTVHYNLEICSNLSVTCVAEEEFLTIMWWSPLFRQGANFQLVLSILIGWKYLNSQSEGLKWARLNFTLEIYLLEHNLGNLRYLPLP